MFNAPFSLKLCVTFLFFFGEILCAQNPPAFSSYNPRGPGPLPINGPAGINAIGGDIGPFLESTLAKFDYTHTLDELRKKSVEEAQHRKKLLESGQVSALDLDAPLKAVQEFNEAAKFWQDHKSPDAVAKLKKAIAHYPKFVSAHNNLGLAYLDQGDVEHARAEFELAATLDPKFPGSFINLGRLALSQENMEVAQKNLELAASLLPNDPGMLSMLSYIYFRNSAYQRAIDTAANVHRLGDQAMANVHFIAAASAGALRDLPTVQQQLEQFLAEDPTNPLAPIARRNLEALADRNKPSPVASAQTITRRTFPNADRLKAELASLADETANDACAGCIPTEIVGGTAEPAIARQAAPAGPASGFVLRKYVDEVAIFFSVYTHGHSITDLQADQVNVLDASKPPKKILKFIPQSKLPLRLGLLIDTSGSVQPRFSFEKDAATKFLKNVLKPDTDLAFVAGFADSTLVTQDFTSSLDDLGTGIKVLNNEGGTALFDAMSFACWKLGAYPGGEHAANVLVVLTDGEDNYSKTRLRQVLRSADLTGVTIYAISTSEHALPTTYADKLLVEIAERTGGEAIFPTSFTSIENSFNKLQDIIRNRYLIAYRPADFTPDGSYRTIQISAEQKGHRLNVQARRGYFARSTSNSQANPQQ